MKFKKKNKIKQITSIDLFAGAGGMTLGFEQAGFQTLAAIENYPSCVEALNHNFPNLKVFPEDIRAIKSKNILNRCGLKRGELDVVYGGPPCQGFSIIGLRDRNDKRCGLIFEFHRIVSELQPKSFVMENVPGMISADNGKFLKKLLELLENDGYKITTPIQILDASEFGVPQARKRVFIVGIRDDIGLTFKYPNPTHRSLRINGNGNKRVNQFGDKLDQLPYCPSVRDAISDLPCVDRYDHLIDLDTIAYDKNPESDYAKIMRGAMDDTDSEYSAPIDWNKQICTGCRRTVHGKVLTGRFKETVPGQTVPISRLYKLKWDDVANTLRAGTPRERGAYSSPRPVHPEQPRVITVREGARLQSFPDWHRFHPTKWHGFMQVGNAVPPLLARAIAKELKKVLFGL